MDRASSSAGGSTKPVPTDQTPSITTIDDAVSLIRSLEVLPEEGSNSHVVPSHIQYILLPALKRQYHAQKGKGQRLFLQALQGGIDPLSMLDPAHNSLGYAYILACRTGQVATGDDVSVLADYIDAFAKYFTPAELIGAGEIVTVLARNIANIGLLLSNPLGALTSTLRIFDGFRAVQGGPHNLSTLQPIVLFQCLRAHHYHAAVDWVLKYDIIGADGDITPLVYTDVLEYFYYGGLLWAGLNILDKACEFFELCVTSPSHQVSAIQIDAYKKLILLQLLKDGKITPLPRYTSQVVNRAIRSKIAGLEVYQNIAKAYEVGPAVKVDLLTKNHQAQEVQIQLEGEVNRGMEILSKDQNVGLVKQLLAVFTRRRIQRMSILFNRLTLEDILGILGGTIEGKKGEEAYIILLAALRQMDADRWLQLTIEEEANVANIAPSKVVVRFSEVQADHTDLEAAQRLTRIMQEAKDWDHIVEVKQKSVRSSEAFLSKQMNPSSRGAFGALNVEDYDDDAFS